MKLITSPQNSKILNLIKLKQTKNIKKEQKFLIEGYHLISECKDDLIETYSIHENDNPDYLITPTILKLISSSSTPQGILGLVELPNMMNNKFSNKILLLDNVQDPGNVGTLIRTAVAFGYKDIVLRKSAFPFSPKCIAASQGAFLKINISILEKIGVFDDYQKIGALVDKSAKAYNEIKLKDKFVLILGNEGNGISSDIIDALEQKVYIPIEFESLNVAQAGAILLNEYK